MRWWVGWMSGVRLHVSSQFDEMPCSLGLVRVGRLGRYLAAAENQKGSYRGASPMRPQAPACGTWSTARLERELRNWAVLLGSLLKTCLGFCFATVGSAAKAYHTTLHEITSAKRRLM